MKTNVFESGIPTRESPKSFILQGKVLKQNATEVTVNLVNSRQLDSIFCSIKDNEDCEELYEFSRFHIIFLNLLHIQASFKKEILRDNNQKAIVVRSRLKNRLNKTKSD